MIWECYRGTPKKWKSVIGQVPKRIRCIDGSRDSVDGISQEELAPVRKVVPIKYMN